MRKRLIHVQSVKAVVKALNDVLTIVIMVLSIVLHAIIEVLFVKVVHHATEGVPFRLQPISVVQVAEEADTQECRNKHPVLAEAVNVLRQLAVVTSSMLIVADATGLDI